VRIALALAALSGLLYFLGVPGVGLWPLALIAQAPLILALRGQPPGRAAVIGLTAGFTFSVGTFYWLHGTMRLFGGFSAPVALALMLLMCAYQGGRAGLTGWLYARAAARGWPGAIAFVLAFTTGELVWPLLFPWYFAFTVANAPALMQPAELGSVYLVGALLVGSSLAVAELGRARLERDRPSRVVVAAGLLAPILGAAWGALRMRQIEARQAAAPAITVGVAQGNQPFVGRPLGVGIHRRLTRKLHEQGAELVVWSEGSVPDVFDEATYREDTKRRVTRGLKVPVIFGGGVKRTEGGRTREFNTALLADAEGDVIGRYDKQYLLPFGEYLPFGETFPSLYEGSPNSGRLSPGDSLEPVILDGHRISVIICYEDLLPGFVNRVVRHARPELLVNLTIDTWFGHTLEPWQHLGLSQLRAVEHRRYLVRANNSGVSAIIDATGRVVAHGELFTEEGFIGQARFLSDATVYERLGDAPFYAGALAIAAMALFRRPEKALRAR
jgi:apolipoprotein N-acyltransferase